MAIGFENPVPPDLSWLFPEFDLAELDVKRDRNQILARVLERGRLVDVQWALRCYGPGEIRDFFRTAASPELSARTVAFWRAYFKAENEPWKSPPSWRNSSSVRWPS